MNKIYRKQIRSLRFNLLSPEEIKKLGAVKVVTPELYDIDGFPVENPDPAALNPEEIESMTILKDASSTAIYGSRAANGVILIQTKRGKEGKPVVSFSSYPPLSI